MSIVRAPRPTEKFYILDKRISEDRRLSWAARGLLIFLLGKPDHWQVSVAALANETAMGRDGIRGLLQELIAAGYVNRLQSRQGGRFDTGLYEVSELAAIHSQIGGESKDLPAPVEPSPAKPSPANPTQVRTDLKQGLKEAKDSLGHPKPTAAGAAPDVPPKQTDMLGEAQPPRTPRRDPMRGFTEFWQHYPRKTAKGAAERAWPKALAEVGGDPDEIIWALKARLHLFDRRESGRFIPHPATWLNGKCWLDGVEPEPGGLFPPHDARSH